MKFSTFTICSGTEYQFFTGSFSIFSGSHFQCIFSTFSVHIPRKFSIGLGPLVEVSGKINGQRYREVLHDHLLPFLNELGDESIYYFQDDNAPSHSAKETIQWKEDNLIPSIPWPAQSPDLNPIEHLWDVLEKKLRSRKPLPKNKIELIDALNEEWLHIEPRITENLVLSMPRRVKAVIESHGNPTLY